MPEMGELDKIIIQDLIERKNKSRDAILEGVRYGGVVLVAASGYYVTKMTDPAIHQRMTPELKEDIFELTSAAMLFGGLLAFGFFWLMRHHVISLRTALHDVNAHLDRWREKIDDTRTIKLGQNIAMLSLAAAISLLALSGLMETLSHMEHNIIMKKPMATRLSTPVHAKQ